MGKENKRQLTLGSLFSGSGGFELAGLLAGVKPVWNCEVEPFPILVTSKRFPWMKHYGDISSLNGAELPPVDIITGGFPCQSVSVAGRRDGVKHIDHGAEMTTRSGLFYEATRIIKEMRGATDGNYPRYAVAENVPGLFSSGGGEDFRQVLEEICKIKMPEAVVPPVKKWNYAGLILGGDFSVAWRVLDAQYWGVAQRRRRVFIVADFAGESAGKILFESESVSGYSAEGFRAWQSAAGNSAEGAGEAGGIGGTSDGTEARYCLNDQGGSRMDVTDDVASTLRAEAHHPPVVMGAAGFCTEHSAKARNIGYEEEKSPTLRAGVVPAAVFENHSQDTRYTGPLDTAPTVNATYGMGGNNQPFVVDAPDAPDESDVPITLKIRSGSPGGGKGPIWQTDQSATLGCNNDQTVFVPEGCAWDGRQTVGALTDKNARGVQRMPDKGNFNCVLEPKKEKTAFGISSKDSNAMKSANPHAGIYEATTSRTLDSAGGNPSANQGGICIVESSEPVAFTQNQRDEIRDLQGKAGALAAEPGMKQQTFVLQGSMIGRDDRNGPQGDGVNEDVSFTLNTIDRHAVCAPEEKDLYAMTTGYYMKVEKDVVPTLLARDYKDPATVAPVEPPEGPSYGIDRAAFNQGQNAQFGFSVEEELSPTLVAKGPCAVSKPEPVYTVRRLTPTECARLQGFPDWWCSNLGTENPTAEDIAFWADVFETHRRVITKTGKPKTEKQIIKWLKNPHSDSAEYRLWGNGLCLPIVVMLMYGIKWADSLTE